MYSILRSKANIWQGTLWKKNVIPQFLFCFSHSLLFPSGNNNECTHNYCIRMQLTKVLTCIIEEYFKVIHISGRV